MQQGDITQNSLTRIIGKNAFENTGVGQSMASHQIFHGFNGCIRVLATAIDRIFITDFDHAGKRISQIDRFSDVLNGIGKNCPRAPTPDADFEITTIKPCKLMPEGVKLPTAIDVPSRMIT